MRETVIREPTPPAYEDTMEHEEDETDGDETDGDDSDADSSHEDSRPLQSQYDPQSLEDADLLRAL